MNFSDPSYLPSVSVLVPTLDRPQLVCDTIRALLAQTVRPAQLIIVEQGEPSDDVATTLRDVWGASGILIRDATLGASAARSAGMAHALSDIIICLDDD